MLPGESRPGARLPSTSRYDLTTLATAAQTSNILQDRRREKHVYTCSHEPVCTHEYLEEIGLS